MKEHYKYKLIIQYDGTNYSGWQIQPNAPSVQETIEQTLKQFLQEKIRIVAAGRTDAGVHAKGQVAHFFVSKKLDLNLFLKAANGLLPRDIRILTIEEVDEQFHSQYSSKGKIYHYHLCLERFHSPFHDRFTTHFPIPLDMKILQEAAKQFVGKKNFASFANSAEEGASGKNPIRTIHSISIHPEEGGIRIEFYGDGFLYKMIRNIVGMLLDVARGKRPIEDIQIAFEKQDRRFVSKAAPARGLHLVKVFY